MKKNAWIKSTILSTLLGSLITFIIDYIRKKPMLTTIINLIKQIFNMTVAFLNFEIKVWWLLLGILFIIIIYSFISKSERFDFRIYIEDEIKGFHWSWSWDFDNSIDNLKPHCPHCDTGMTSRYYSSFECPRCDHIILSENIPDIQKIRSIIIDNLDRKIKLKNK